MHKRSFLTLKDKENGQNDKRAIGEDGESQSEVCSFERELNEILEFNREHLQFPESEKICHIQKLINLAKDEYDFYDPEYERSVMFPNGEDEEEDDFAL